MDPIDKVRQEIEYWEHQEREARQNLRAAENILPNLRETLRGLEQEEVSSGPALVDQSSPADESTRELSGSIPDPAMI